MTKVYESCNRYSCRKKKSNWLIDRMVKPVAKLRRRLYVELTLSSYMFHHKQIANHLPKHYNKLA